MICESSTERWASCADCTQDSSECARRHVWQENGRLRNETCKDLARDGRCRPDSSGQCGDWCTAMSACCPASCADTTPILCTPLPSKQKPMGCSNVAVFSKWVWDRMANARWSSLPAGFGLASLTVLFVVILVLCALQDRKDCASLGWSRNMLLTHHRGFQGQGRGDEWICCRSLWQLHRGPEHVSEYVIAACVRHVCAHSAGLLARDTQILVRLALYEDEHTKHTSPGAKLASTQPHLHPPGELPAFQKCVLSKEHSGDSACADADFFSERGRILRSAAELGAHRFATASKARKAMLVLQACHPLATIRVFSFTESRTSRALKLFAKFFGGFAATAIAFLGTVENTAPIEYQGVNCNVASVRDTWLPDLAFGVIGAATSLVPVWGLGLLNRRQFIFSSTWTEEQIQKQKCLWLAGDFLFWICGLMYLGACAVFLSAFVASVNDRTAVRWLVSAAYIIAEVLLLIPLGIGSFVFAVVGLFSFCTGSSDLFSALLHGAAHMTGHLIGEIIRSVFMGVPINHRPPPTGANHMTAQVMYSAFYGTACAAKEVDETVPAPKSEKPLGRPENDGEAPFSVVVVGLDRDQAVCRVSGDAHDIVLDDRVCTRPPQRRAISLPPPRLTTEPAAEPWRVLDCCTTSAVLGTIGERP